MFWTTPIFVPMQRSIGSSRVSYQDTIQNLKIRRLVRWRLMTCSLPIKDKYFHEEFSQLLSLHRSHLVQTSISQMCRTFVSLWGLLYSWWNSNCLRNSSPWIQMLAVLKTWTFPISQNALHCLLLHPLRIVFVFFALDHSPCARMIWIPTTNLILLRRLQWRNVEALLIEGKQQVSPFYRDFLLLPEWRSCVHERNVFETCALLLEDKQQVSPFHHPSIHQISTLEENKFYQYSILSSLMSVLSQRVGGARDWCHGRQLFSPFYHTSQLSRWEACLVFPGLSDAADDRADGGLSMLRVIKLTIVLDFAVTLSSPDSFCVLFDITSEHSAELKWLMWNKHKRWFHSSRVKFHLVNMSASWFFGINVFNWNFGVQIDSINQSRTTLWVLETCLIVGLLPFIIILITASLSSNTYNKASWC